MPRGAFLCESPGIGMARVKEKYRVKEWELCVYGNEDA